jgi:hypothetical protein
MPDPLAVIADILKPHFGIGGSAAIAHVMSDDLRDEGYVIVSADALKALDGIAGQCIELHAQVQMDTPEDKARHAQAVEAMRASLAAARTTLEGISHV